LGRLDTVQGQVVYILHSVWTGLRTYPASC